MAKLSDRQTWTLDLSGAVFDPPSIEVFWEEVTGGAYGEVDRIEAIFSFADGQGIRFDFDGTSGDSQYQDLDHDPNLNGRPDRPAYFTIVGKALDTQEIETTLAASSLSDAILEYYQSQIREQLAS